MPTFITHKPIDDISITGSEFGARIPPEDGASSNHQGLDFPVNKVKVYATHRGVVTLRHTKKGGNIITLTRLNENGEPTNDSTTFLHLNNYAKITDADGIEREIRDGDIVNGGTQIAISGNTGISSGPHLHFIVTVNGIPENPRTHLAEAERTRREFSKVVQSGTFGIELTGDQRDNFLIGNTRPNIMTGLGGEDTYYIPSLNNDQSSTANYQIFDYDGRLIIGDSNTKASVFLNGDAMQEAPGKWKLKGFDLIKDNNNLVIVLSGSNPSNVATARVTIVNYDFNSLEPKFGINLGKEKELLGESAKLSDAEAFSGNVFANSNKQGRFFAPVMMQVGDTQDYGIRAYDSEGFPLNTLTLTTNRNSIAEDGSGTVQALYTGGQSVQLENGNIAFVYAVNEINYGSGSTFLHGKSTAHLAVMDSKGALVCNDQIDEAVSTDWTSYNSNLMNPSFVNTHSGTGRNTLGFIRGGNRFFCGEFALDGAMSASL